MTARKSSSDAPLPTHIGERYTVEALLGAGGMGRVFRVQDRTTGQTLALKQLDLSRSARRPELAEMFSREYRTLAQLAHPSVIAVHDYGVTDDSPYYTMELLRGTDLHEAAPVDWRLACRYARDVCSCLALLHSRRLIHRDVSPRNVRCDGERAKLIDFGAMMPMGPAAQIVGTPPLVPPEVLAGQALDGRCDLFALGATLYWALSRRHAYPARSLDALPGVWEHRPAPLPAGVPEALASLIHSLLALEVDARPRTAAEVMQRLCAIADLDGDEHLHVPRAYLTAPSLTGRKPEVAALRTLLANVRAGHSRNAFVVGPQGSGRTRMLDVASVEARLSGYRVLRLQANDAAGVDCGIADALLARIDEHFPDDPADSVRPPGLQVTHAPSPELGEVSRARRLSWARAAVRRIAARTPLLLAVDDADALDAASQALLATLTKSTRRRLVVLLAVRTGAPLHGALADTQARAQISTLSPLEESESEDLLRSVFGDVPGLPTMATAIFGLAQGNPRTTMELAQHLVDTGRARYGQGGWELPEQLLRADLPDTLFGVLEGRLSALQPDVRDLADVLAYAETHGLSFEDLDGLTVHGNPARRAAAFDALVAAGLVQQVAERPVFTSTALPDSLRETMDDAQRRRINACLATHLQASAAHAGAIARCHQRAGAAAQAIDVLLAALSHEPQWPTAPGDYGDVLLRAVQDCRRLDRPDGNRVVLLMELVRVGDHLAVPDMRKHYGELLQLLSHAAGADLFEGQPADMEPLARVQEMFPKLLARHEQLPEQRRVMPPADAIGELAKTARQVSAFGAACMDADIIDLAPDVRPFSPLSDAIDVTANLTLPAGYAVCAGRYEEARGLYERIVEIMHRGDELGLEHAFWHWGVGALYFVLGHINAGMGIRVALDYADKLQAWEGWEVPAEDVRCVYHQRYGNWQQAEAARIRRENLILESGRRPQMVGTSARLELDAAAHAGDLMMARRALRKLEPLIELHPGFACYRHFGPAVCALLEGDHQTALSEARAAVAMVQVGRHPTWSWIVECELTAMIELGMVAEACALAQVYLADAQREGLQLMTHHVVVPLALAEARRGEIDSAVQRLDGVIAYREELGVGGVNLGWAYEQRARVAIWAGDAAGFNRAAERCAREYGRGRGGSSLMGKYEALRAEAQAARIATPSELPDPISHQDATAVTTTHFADAMVGAASFRERCQRAMQLVLQETGASAGALFRWTDEGVSRVARAPRGCGLPANAERLAGLCFAEASADDEDEELVTATETGAVGGSYGDAEGWLPIGLSFFDRGRYRRSGVALLHFEGQPGLLSLELIEFVARLLQQ